MEGARIDSKNRRNMFKKTGIVKANKKGHSFISSYPLQFPTLDEKSCSWVFTFVWFLISGYVLDIWIPGYLDTYLDT